MLTVTVEDNTRRGVAAKQLANNNVLEKEKETANIAPNEFRAQGAHGLRQAGRSVCRSAPAVGLHCGQQSDLEVDKPTPAAGRPLGDHAHRDFGSEDDREGRPQVGEQAEHAPAEARDGEWDHAAEDVECGAVELAEVFQSAQIAQGSQVYATSHLVN